MRLYIALPSGKIHSVVVSDSANSRAIMMDLLSNQEADVNYLTLMFKGSPIDKRASLSEQGISNGCLITTTFNEEYSAAKAADALQEQFFVYVVSETGKQKSIKVSKKDTMQSVCNQIFGADARDQRLLYNGLSVNSALTVENYGLTNGSVLMAQSEFPV